MPTQTLVKTRLHLLDELRGIAVILMIVYHTMYDLSQLFDIQIPFLFSPVMNLLRNTFISGPFIFIAGISSHLSRSSLKRGMYALAFGLCLTAVTLLFAPSQLIMFGILHLLGLSMIITHFIKPLLNRLEAKAGLIISWLLFFIAYGLPYRYIGFGSVIKFKLPDIIYSTNYLFPLGIKSSTFVSSDYYPLIPWIFIFIAGFYAGKLMLSSQLPEVFYTKRFKLLSCIGTHSMLIYLVHQPVVLGAIYVVSLIIKL